MRTEKKPEKEVSEIPKKEVSEKNDPTSTLESEDKKNKRYILFIGKP